MICEVCFRLSNVFNNVKVRLFLISENFLKLAVLIKKEIIDELFIKTIYLRRFYPANKTLVQLLYTRREFYSPLLKSDIITEIIEDLWNCDYYHTYNVFNTASCYHNLTGKLIILDNDSVLGKTSSEASSTQDSKINSKRHMDAMAGMFYNENAVKLAKLRDINFSNPFHFIRCSIDRDYKLTNHIFSFFYWQKSPFYRVLLEGLVYIIFFIIIVNIAFKSFELRRTFVSFPDSILIIVDTFIGIIHGYAPAPEFYQVILPWMKKNKVTDPRLAIYAVSKIPDFCEAMLMFVPEFKSQCGVYRDASSRFWPVAEEFIRNQIFFYFTFLGTCLEMLYFYLLHKRLLFNAKILIDLVISFTNIYITYIYYDRVNGKILIVRDDMLASYAVVETNMIIFLFLMWLKFFIYLKLTKTFGYVLKVIEIMLFDLIDFLIIFAVIILAFSLILYDVLSESHFYFNSLISTIRTLLFVTYGGVFFDGFKDNETLGSVLIIIFSLVSIILLLNLLVAILNNTYKTIFERSNLENANIFYSNYLARKPDKFRSALISFPPPVNLIIIPFIPFLIIKKSSRLNYYVCLLGFSLYVITYMSLYIIVNLIILIPLCWGKYLLSIYINVISRSNSGGKGYILLLMWFFGGIFHLIYLLFKNDVKLFFHSIFHISLNKDSLDEITLEEIDLIKKTARKLSSMKTTVTLAEYLNAIRNDLDLLNKSTRKYQMEHASKDNEFNPKKLNVFKFLSHNQQLGNDQQNTPLPDQNLIQGVEIDKMEVFSLIKQYAGVNGDILLSRIIYLLDSIMYCKKFHFLKLEPKKKMKITNFVQIVDIAATERAVLGILSNNLKSQEQFEIVNNSNRSQISPANKKFVDEGKERVRSSKVFLNSVLKSMNSKRYSEMDGKRFSQIDRKD